MRLPDFIAGKRSTLHCLMRYSGNKVSSFPSFKSGGSGLYFFYGVKNPRLTSPNQSVESI